MKFIPKEELKYKPGDVVTIYKNNSKKEKKIIAIILNIVEKKIISSDYNGIVEKEYFVYKGFSSNEIITINEYEIIA